MAEKIVTLYIDDTSLRLMVSDGKQIKKWADLPLEPGLVENAVVLKEAEVAAKIKQILKAQKVTAKKVVLGVSGLNCLTRPMTLPQLPRVMLAEAVRREAKRVLPVPLEQLYLSWQTTPTVEKKIQIFSVAIPRKAADTLLKALRRAGLKPDLMDLKPLLLARVVREATAIIVDVQPTTFDIVIMSDGVPQPIRTLPFANEALSWQEKLTTIRSELDRTITFFNSNNPEKTLTASVPIFASGELADEPEICQSLSDELGHPVLPMPSPLECPEGLAPSRYVANIGLILKKLLPRGEAGPSVVNLNILPIPYQPKPISLTNILALPGAAIAAGLLVLLLMLNQSAAAEIASIRVQLNATDQLFRQKISQRQELAQNIDKLQKEIAQVEVSRENFTAALSSLEKQSVGINHGLETTINSLPDTISLSSVSYADSILTITGRAPNEGDVLTYLRQLHGSGKFGDIIITNMTRIEGEGIVLTLLGSLEKQGNVASSIEVALSKLPTTISLTSVNYTDGTLTMNGRSPDENEVLSYLRDLDASGKFLEITIASMTRIDEEIDFSVVLKTGE